MFEEGAQETEEIVEEGEDVGSVLSGADAPAGAGEPEGVAAEEGAGEEAASEEVAAGEDSDLHSGSGSTFSFGFNTPPLSVDENSVVDTEFPDPLAGEFRIEDDGRWSEDDNVGVFRYEEEEEVVVVGRWEV